MALDDRREGYYWIETINGWEPAHWNNGAWWLTGVDFPSLKVDGVQVGDQLRPPDPEVFRAGDDPIH